MTQGVRVGTSQDGCQANSVPGYHLRRSRLDGPCAREVDEARAEMGGGYLASTR